MHVATDNIEHDFVTILYVDDEELARKYFTRSFGADYEVLTASGADAAIEILQDKDKQVSILVTDYRMPSRNGGDLLRQIACEFPYVVRILVTAYADREVLLDTANTGEVFRIIEKPLDLDEVRIALRLASELSRERITRQQKLMAIDDTLAFLAHELNTPLAAITNFTRGVQHRLAEESLPSKQRTEIGNAALAINDNARYCLSLLSTFIASVKGASAIFTHRTNSTAQQMISSLIDTYPLTSVQRALIRVDIQEDFRIGALQNCVALVLSSILSNALRAIQDQLSPMICITALVEGNPQIRVVDNGSGIPHEILERLLVDPVTTHADVGGSGWGLIFCKRIMQSFNGDILIESIPNIHTTVTLNFPITKNQAKRSDQ